MDGSFIVAYIFQIHIGGTIKDACVVKSFNVIFIDIDIIHAGDLLYHSVPIFRFHPKCQKEGKQDENVECFKEHFGVEPITGQCSATVHLYHCS